MKKLLNIIIILIILLSLCSCKKEKVNLISSSNDIYVRKIENLNDDFIMGADLSSVVSLEKSSVSFYDYEGNQQDIFKTLAQSGINYIRVRVWNDPYDKDGNSYGGGNCDIDNAVEIGKRATKYGMKLLVDFHYSDFWADPNKQMCPKAWQGLDIESKSNALYEYTKKCLERLKQENIDVGMVQMGNETNGALAGETIWMNIINYLMASSSKAIREVFPNALIAVHFANPENTDSYYSYAKKLDYYNLDYDVFGTSYYPFWHGSLDNLQEVLSTIAEKYNKKVMVLETSYPYTDEDFDFSGNTISDESSITKNYPFSIQGQVNSLLNIIETIVNTTNGIGICYWEPAWISVGANSYEENQKIWETYGSGWASSFAKEYDPDDAGKYYGGSAVDNQALFDSNGLPLESLKVFALARTGNQIELKIDSIEETNIVCDINTKIELPDKVNAIMNDSSKSQVDVLWDDFNEEELKNKGTGIYQIKGKANDVTCICNISLIEYNYLKNYSFEEDDNKTHIPTSWDFINHANTNEIYVEDKISDSLTGNKHYHFWASLDNSINFELEQKVNDIGDGTYKYSISIMGGDCINQNIYMYVKINGKEIAKKPLTITTYNNWDSQTIDDILYNEEDELIIGIHVETQGQANGAWGKIDDAILNLVN